MTKNSFRLTFLMLPIALSLVLGCAPKSPEERVAELRSFYSARPVGFIVDARPEPFDPMAVEETVDGEAAAGDRAAEAGGAAGEDADGEGLAEDMKPVEVRQDILIDILLRHNSRERLDGITLDISMVDGAKVEKGHWRKWVDTADLPRATGTQFTHLLEDVDYFEGDGFTVEVRHPIPVEERGDYREFSAATSG